MDTKLQPAADYHLVLANSTYVVPKGKYSKGCRINSAGVVTFTSHAGTEEDWDCLHGERIDLGGNISVTTDGDAQVMVYL